MYEIRQPVEPEAAPSAGTVVGSVAVWVAVWVEGGPAGWVVGVSVVVGGVGGEVRRAAVGVDVLAARVAGREVVLVVGHCGRRKQMLRWEVKLAKYRGNSLRAETR